MNAALTAEVRALLETIEARGLRRNLARWRSQVEQLIAEGEAEGGAAFPKFSATWDYFAVYEALLPKLGLLPPHRTSLIVRFYVAAKSSSEVLMHRSGDARAPIPFPRLLDHLRTEERLADRTIGIAHAIVGETIVTMPHA